MAVDDVFIAVAHDRGFDVGGVRGGDVRFGHREGGADFTGQQAFEIGFLVLRGAVADKDFHIAGIGCRAVERLRREGRAAHELGERGVFEVGEAGAQLALRQEEVPQALGLGFLLDFLKQDERLPAIDGLVAGGEQLVLIGVDVLGHEVGDAGAQGGDLWGV